MPNQVESRDTIIVGGGQAGLAMSYQLTQQGRDHLILEKHDRIGETWRRRWDSFTLVTPNWMLRLPGHPYQGNDPDGFLSRDEVVAYLEGYAARIQPPLRFGTTVTAIEDDGSKNGFVVRTTDRDYTASNVVVAAGTFQRPRIPPAGHEAPPHIRQLHTSEYRNPGALPDGGVLVVGSGQSGAQIALELHESGRSVWLCVGGAVRVPRRYRGKDAVWWMDRVGVLDHTIDDLDSPKERFAPNPHVSGRDGGMELNLHRFARDGIALLGRLRGFDGGRAIIAPDLHDSLAAADKAVAEFCDGVDQFVDASGIDAPDEDLDEPRDGFEQEEVMELDLAGKGIGSIVWATGYGWDLSWVKFPVFDEYGYPAAERGVTNHPGLYFVGLHFLHTRKSGLFYGIADDTAHVSEHLAGR